MEQVILAHFGMTDYIFSQEKLLDHHEIKPSEKKYLHR